MTFSTDIIEIMDSISHGHQNKNLSYKIQDLFIEICKANDHSDLDYFLQQLMKNSHHINMRIALTLGTLNIQRVPNESSTIFTEFRKVVKKRIEELSTEENIRQNLNAVSMI